MSIRRIEIDFALPVEITEEEHQALDRFVSRICKRNCPEGWTHWPAGCGAKPNFSQADAMFLGKMINPDAPVNGEPTWDDSIYSIDCCARELYPEEVERNNTRAAKAQELKMRWDSRLAGWLHRHGLVTISWWVADASMWIRRNTKA